MDRFIDHIANQTSRNNKYLKSNMDRFIVNPIIPITEISSEFKIQYGQIYRSNGITQFIYFK